MRRWLVLTVVTALALSVIGYAYHRHREGVAYREKARFWELLQKHSLKADEDAELEELRHRVGEREADRPGRDPR